MPSVEPELDFALTRVVAALDVVCQPLEAVATAVDIATRCKVELVGLFIEDDSLFRLATTPAARHLTLTSTGEAPPAADVLEIEMRLRSDRAAAALRAAADAAGVSWSFRVVRGMPGAMLRQATRSGDLTVVAGETSVAGLPLRAHSPLLRAAGAATGSALFVRRAVSRSRPLVIASADRGTIRRAIAAVRRLQSHDHDPIDIIVAGRHGEAARRALDDLAGILRVREVADQASKGVIDLANAIESDMLVLAPGGETPGDQGFFEELLTRADRQVLLVRP